MNSHMNDLLAKLKKQINEYKPEQLNNDQKALIEKILDLVAKDESEKTLNDVYGFLAQRVLVGFKFDLAPTQTSKKISLLEKDEQRSFILNEQSNHNQLIIGENYDALVHLINLEKERETNALYDIIYIDPPYNTEASFDDGNALTTSNEKPNKFIYRDKFGHHGWLNMLNERLKLAYELLKDDGVIFVSIDDNEQAYLKCLMDTIFGERNFIANMIWKKKSGFGGNTTFDYKININTEYILLYAKNKDLVNFDYIQYNDEEIQNEYTNRDEYFNERGGYKLTPLFRKATAGAFGYVTSLDYEIEAPDKTFFRAHQNIKKAETGCYTWGKDAWNAGTKLGFTEVIKNNEGYWVAYRKQYAYCKFNPKTKKIEYMTAGKPFDNIIDDDAQNEKSKTKARLSSSAGTSELTRIFGDSKIFSFPKPVSLIERLISMIKNKDARVLDFYAGSGTTGHAVINLNKKDEGNRSYTLCTNNENEIGERVTYERLYRINHGEGTNKESFDWIKKNEPYKTNLDVFKLTYHDVGLDINDNFDIQPLKDKLLKELNDFGIILKDQNQQEKINEYLSNILYRLNALETKEDEEEMRKQNGTINKSE